MIEKLIRWSIKNRFLALLATLLLFFWGLWAIKNALIDAQPGTMTGEMMWLMIIFWLLLAAVHLLDIAALVKHLFTRR
ncbi:hypothetical protein QGN06_04235 [Achromobacter xylosoxidans]|uniref:hypothetical protein n=1 Tax=Alcaligenes xylosoxydans xylosoxydans TaxID=85698 RepID=UPI003F5DBE86